MFFYIGLIFFLLGCVPLFVALSKAKTSTPQQTTRRVKRGVYIILADAAVIILVNVFFSIYIDYLWFRSVGFQQRFFTVIGAQILLYLGSALFTFGFISLLLKFVPANRNTQIGHFFVLIAAFIAAFILAVPVAGAWEEILLFVYQTPSSFHDPIFQMPMNFYLFSLPFFTTLLSWLFFLVVISLGIVIMKIIFSTINGDHTQFLEPGHHALKRMKGGSGVILFLIALLFFLVAGHFYLNRFRLLYSTAGVVTGAGYVDVQWRTLGYTISTIIFLIAGIISLIAAFLRKLRGSILGIHFDANKESFRILPRNLIVIITAVALLLVFNWALPGLVQTVYVNPNEITVEKPFISNSIELTRQGYGIDSSRIESKWYSVGKEIDQSVLQQNRNTLLNIRLWDSRALMDNLEQQQEIRLYYQFHDVDIDRYHIDGDYRQVMLSARELQKEDLDPRSKTWVSQHIKYTHGYGLVLLPVHEVLEQGGPNLIIKGIPPRESVPSLHIQQPSIYYGELTNDHVYVQTTEQAFHYPSGDTNVYTTYEGTGGVPLSNWFRRIVFAWKFDGYRQLFSTYFTDKSRIMFRREITQRVQTLAPFLKLDRDPYAVISADGGIKYIIDAYTVSEAFPYSEKYRGYLGDYYGINYIRNSVKVVVDAYDGKVTFYTMDKNDIILQTYRTIFPDLFTPFEQMPEYIRSHIRYPVDIFTIQAEMYSTYHMNISEVFYQQEDVWRFATERYRENFQVVVPYYVMLHFPDTEQIEFVLMLPFTPKNKNVMNAWMAARCDFPEYGKLTVYTLPKGIEVFGPRQIEARIDQDTEMSRAMTLWGQRGSEVIRGNLLAIPLFTENSLYFLYVEPIFVQAEHAQLPEIKRIVAADQLRVVWSETFEQAIDRLLRDSMPISQSDTNNNPQTQTAE